MRKEAGERSRDELDGWRVVVTMMADWDNTGFQILIRKELERRRVNAVSLEEDLQIF